MNIKDLEITYMGKKCTIADYVKHHKKIKECTELEKIGAIVYIDSIVKNIDIKKEYMSFDYILEWLQFNFEKCNFLAIKVIVDKKIKEVPDYITRLFESKDDDERYDLFVKFLLYCKVS
jgi:hypothetical protein